MSAKVSTEQQITGGDLRSRVRRITAGCVGLAAVASAALTINLAASADDNKASADPPAADARVPAPTVTAPTTAQAPPSPHRPRSHRCAGADHQFQHPGRPTAGTGGQQRAQPHPVGWFLMSTTLGARALNSTAVRIDFEVWSTTATLIVTDPTALDIAQATLGDELAAIDATCSRFRADSEISRVLAIPGHPVILSPLLNSAVSQAIRVAEATGGLVDPTVAAAVIALGYDRDIGAVVVKSIDGDHQWPTATASAGPGCAPARARPGDRRAARPARCRHRPGRDCQSAGRGSGGCPHFRIDRRRECWSASAATSRLPVRHRPAAGGSRSRTTTAPARRCTSWCRSPRVESPHRQRSPAAGGRHRAGRTTSLTLAPVRTRNPAGAPSLLQPAAAWTPMPPRRQLSCSAPQRRTGYPSDGCRPCWSTWTATPRPSTAGPPRTRWCRHEHRGSVVRQQGNRRGIAGAVHRGDGAGHPDRRAGRNVGAAPSGATPTAPHPDAGLDGLPDRAHRHSHRR